MEAVLCHLGEAEVHLLPPPYRWARGKSFQRPGNGRCWELQRLRSLTGLSLGPPGDSKTAATGGDGCCSSPTNSSARREARRHSLVGRPHQSEVQLKRTVSVSQAFSPPRGFVVLGVSLIAARPLALCLLGDSQLPPHHGGDTTHSSHLLARGGSPPALDRGPQGGPLRPRPWGSTWGGWGCAGQGPLHALPPPPTVAACCTR